MEKEQPLKMRTWLVHARMRKNLKQEDVADAVGISRPFYSQIENGVRSPSPQKAKRIASVLDVDWTYFYEDNDRIPPHPRSGLR